MGELVVEGVEPPPQVHEPGGGVRGSGGGDHLDEVTMIDFGTAKILSHRRNIQRCVMLLATELTELERQYLHERIAEERAELERLMGTQYQIKREQLSQQRPVK